MSYDLHSRRAARKTKIRAAVAALSLAAGAGSAVVALTLRFEIPAALVAHPILRTWTPLVLNEEFHMGHEDLGIARLRQESARVNLPSFSRADDTWLLGSKLGFEERSAALKARLARAPNAPKIIPLEGQEGLALMQHAPAGHADARIERAAIVLLPGEEVDFALPGLSDRRNLAFYGRVLGATADRLDAPARVEVTWPDGTRVMAEVSPKGDAVRNMLDIPPAVNMNRKDRALDMEDDGLLSKGRQILQTRADGVKFAWPADAPGAFVFEGFADFVPDADAQRPGAVFLTIDALRGLDDLPLTRAALDKIYGTGHVARLEAAIARAPGTRDNLVSLFTGLAPSESGLFLPAQARHRILENAETLEDTFERAGYATNRIHIGSDGVCDAEICRTRGSPESLTGLSRFRSRAVYGRASELELAGTKVFGEQFDHDNTFTHVNIGLSRARVSATWKGAMASEVSLFRWLWAGASELSGARAGGDAALKDEEKARQIDAVAARLLATLNPRRPPHLALLIQHSEQDDTPGRPGPAFWNPARERGAGLLASPDLNVEAVGASQAVGQEHVVAALARLAFARPSAAETDAPRKAIGVRKPARVDRSKGKARLKDEIAGLLLKPRPSGFDWVVPAAAVAASSQAPEGEMFFTENGWLFLPANSRADSMEWHMPSALLRPAADRLRAHHSALRLHALHVALRGRGPGLQAHAVELSGKWPWIGCFSNDSKARIVSTSSPEAGAHTGSGSADSGTSRAGESWGVALEKDPEFKNDWRIVCLMQGDSGVPADVSVSLFENGAPMDSQVIGMGGYAWPLAPQQDHIAAGADGSGSAAPGLIRLTEDRAWDLLAAREPPAFELYPKVRAFLWRDTLARFESATAAYVPLAHGESRARGLR